ncbi:protein GSKIP homolog [Drosophila persimilis]|uniref:protein GSKIP homolog n=1 Tax=Drosophila persimilis TaxID=7234 RepID=UPI000F090398|nr:protein GSKIP homolog [Drosophila persimilis]
MFDAYSEASQMAAAFKECADHLLVAEYLPHNDRVAYLNLRTLEQEIYCVELSFAGFRIVGYDFDCIQDGVSSCDQVYVSAHRLLAAISPLYAEVAESRGRPTTPRSDGGGGGGGGGVAR